MVTQPKRSLSPSSQKPKKSLLSAEQRRTNHISAEKKRRQNIREGYDLLVELVPTLPEGTRNEAQILTRCNFLQINPNSG
jgi:hypothetical protein